MFALLSRRLRRRLSAPTSGSLRRRARDRKRAEQTRAEGERMARERREQRAMEKVEQQRLARTMAPYEPWGRAGGGAPNARGVRFTKIRNSGIYPEDELRGVCQFEECLRWPSPAARRHRRTPLRLREDPQLLYAETLRKSVDNDIRYRRTPDQQRSYKEVLDDMVDKRNKAMKDDKRRDLEYERKMQTLDGPWGRPGPGGTTWRNPRDIGLNFSKSMGWTDNDIFDKLKGEHKRNKRSSLTLPKVKRDDDTKGDSSDKENVQQVKPSSVEKLPDIKPISSPKEKKQEAFKKDGDHRGESQKTVKEIYKPKKKAPKKSKFVKRLSNGERLQRFFPEDDNNGEINNNRILSDANGTSVNGRVVEKKLTPEATILRVTGGVELVPLLARRRHVGARTLPSTDVTRLSGEHCQWRQMDYEDYLRVLNHQMQVKYQRKEQSRKDSAESVRQHHATWASLWGKPGHGAPLRGKYARSNLANLLYVAPLANAAQ